MQAKVMGAIQKNAEIMAVMNQLVNVQVGGRPAPFNPTTESARRPLTILTVKAGIKPRHPTPAPWGFPPAFVSVCEDQASNHPHVFAQFTLFGQNLAP